MKFPCTVGILTFNNEDTLRRTLESVQDFDDIVICDGGSTDRTREIAREFGARIIEQGALFKDAQGRLKDYGGVRNQCLDAARYDWFLYVDSDETISEGLREDIRSITAGKDGALVYKVPIGIMMDGKYLKYSSNYPGYQYRFFNRHSGARFVKAVHERISFDEAQVKIGTLAHPWYVHTTRDYWNHYLRETGGYRPIEIQNSCDAPFSLKAYLRFTLWWQMHASLVICVKALSNYLLHGFKEAVPPQGELGRAAVPLVFAWNVTVCRIKKLFSN